MASLEQIEKTDETKVPASYRHQVLRAPEGGGN
jgi:hypothetical protein